MFDFKFKLKSLHGEFSTVSPGVYSTPFLDWNGDNVCLYYFKSKENQGEVLCSDNGDTAAALSGDGVSRKELDQAFAQTMAVYPELDCSEDILSMRGMADSEEAVERINSRMLQAIDHLCASVGRLCG